MANNAKLAKHASLTTAANLSHAAAQWLLLVIIVKQFDDLVLGNLVLSLSVASPLFLLFSFKLRSLIVTDYHNETTFEQYLHTRLLAHATVILLIILLTPTLLSDVPIDILLCVIIFKVSDSISELCYSYLHRQQAFKRVAQTQISRSVFATVSLITVSQLTSNVTYTFWAWACANLAFAIFDLALIFSQIIRVEQRPLAKLNQFFSSNFFIQSIQIARKYWLIGVSILFSAMFVYLPNYAIEYYLDRAQVGQFAAISYFLVAGGIFINSLSQAVTPKLSILFNQHKQDEFLRLTKLLMLLGASIGFVGLVFAQFIGEWVLELMYSESIAKMHTELMLVILASLVRYSYVFLGSALNVLKCFNQQALVYGSGTLSLAISLIFLVPVYQTIGVGIAMIIGCSVEFIVMLLLFSSKWRKLANS